MSSGLTPAETVYLQQLCTNAWQYPSGSPGDTGYALARSVALKVATGQLGGGDQFEFDDLEDTNPLDMGSF